MAVEQTIRLLEQVFGFYGPSSAAPSCKAEGRSFPLSSPSA